MNLKYETAYCRVQTALKTLIDLLEKYDPNQPRVPAGNSEGGQWTSNGGGGSSISNRGRTGNPSASSTGNRNTASRTPTVVESSHAHTTVRQLDGSLQIRERGSLAWRNNNPGNIRSGTFANRHGAIGDARGFAVFPDEATGQNASIALLRTGSYSNLTINQAIARRSPSNENDTRQVQKIVNQIGGFSGNEIVGKLTSQQMERLAQAIQRSEGWIPGTIRNVPAQR
jgi:hypothetical protein